MSGNSDGFSDGVGCRWSVVKFGAIFGDALAVAVGAEDILGARRRPGAIRFAIHREQRREARLDLEPGLRHDCHEYVTLLQAANTVGLGFSNN